MGINTYVCLSVFQKIRSYTCLFVAMLIDIHIDIQTAECLLLAHVEAPLKGEKVRVHKIQLHNFPFGLKSAIVAPRANKKEHRLLKGRNSLLFRGMDSVGKIFGLFFLYRTTFVTPSYLPCAPFPSSKVCFKRKEYATQEQIVFIFGRTHCKCIHSP